MNVVPCLDEILNEVLRPKQSVVAILVYSGQLDPSFLDLVFWTLILKQCRIHCLQLAATPYCSFSGTHRK